MKPPFRESIDIFRETKKKKKERSHTQETKKTSSWYSGVKTMNGGEVHLLAQAS